ncbi:MAG: M48 family metallopeptidase [Rhodopirellula sp.]|nr:M48 family metallopeptidase [Rhodopirellula sp.]
MTLRHPSGLSARRYQLAVIFSLLCACLIAWGCQTTPVSGRRHLVLLQPEAQEISMGEDAYQEIVNKEPKSKNEQYVEIVERVGKRIAAVAGRDDFNWEFKVIESDQQNAFCLPGGKVAVYEGIIPVCQSEAGLAVVMSHEIAHALARHGGERMQYQNIKDVGGKVVDAAGRWLYKDAYEEKQDVVLTAYGVVSEYGAILPYSRKHETEADLIGIKLMAEAGYDPSEAPIFWERFSAAKNGETPMEFLSTHPSDARRASDLRASLPEAMKLYSKAPKQFGLGDRLMVVESTNVKLPLVSNTVIR